MKELIRAAMDWPRQMADFEPDGSLRDIYVESTTVEDWAFVVAHIFEGNYGARLDRRGVPVDVPGNFESVFATDEGYLLSLTVGGAILTCHFFTPTEIEFSFAPNCVSQQVLHDLLAFMVELGDATTKSVRMTPENCRDSPIFRYDANARQLSWVPPQRTRQ